MKKLVAILIAALTVFTLCIPAFAAEANETKANDPILGSWMLGQVMEIKEGQEPALLAKEENQSLYGAGKGVYTFNDDGTASYIMFNAGDIADTAANWKAEDPAGYIYTGEDGMTETFTYNKEEDALHRTFAEADRTLDFVYNRAIVGTWKLDTVMEINPGDAPTTLKPEENQSLYAEAKNDIIFKADGTGVEIIRDGADETEETGTWKMTDPDKYTCGPEGEGRELNYFRVDDTLFTDIIDDAPEAVFQHLRFIFTRVQ